MSIETELKLSLQPEVARELLQARLLKLLRVGRVRRSTLVSTYFDTSRHLLRRSGAALRIRDYGKSREQTLKVPVPGPAGLQNFREWNWPVSDLQPLLDPVVATGAADFLLPARQASRLRPIFTTRFERTFMLLRTGDSEIELAFDFGSILCERNAKLRELPICEIELELKSGLPDDVFDLALQICESWDVSPAHQTKAERGYALASDALRPRPKKPVPVSLQPNMSAGEAFTLVIGNALAHLADNRTPTLQGRAEGLHQTRVAMRRLRAALSIFAGLLPRHERRHFNAEIQWFHRQLALARDWHVFLKETLPGIGVADRATVRQIDKLRGAGVRKRRKATRQAVELLRSRRYARLVLEFEKWIASLDRVVPADVWRQPIEPFARKVLRKVFDALLTEARQLSRLRVEELHELRKRGKKARYASEFFGSLWPGQDFESQFHLVYSVLKRLGEANDASVASRILQTLPRRRLDADVEQIVQECSRQRVRDCVAAARPYWRQLRACRPFWKRRAAQAKAGRSTSV